MALGNIKLRATSANVTTQINGITAISSSQVTNAPLTHEQLDLNFLELANSIVNLSSAEGITLANQTTTDLVEGTNLYYTDARVDARVANIAVSNIGANAVNDTHIDFGTGANQVSTADIPEETNLYYTDTRVDNRISQASINDLSDVVATSPSNGDILKYVTANLRFELSADTNTTDISANTINQLSDVDTTGVTTNSILKYDGANWVVSTDIDTTDLSANTTTDLAEGTNLYYTDARVDAKVANIEVSNIAIDAVGNTHLDFANISVTSFADIGNYVTTTMTANLDANTYSIINAGNVEAVTFNANADTTSQVSTFTRDQNSAGTTVRALNIKAQSSIDMTDGYGGSLGFKIKDDTAEEDIGSISIARDGADNTGKFVLTLVNAGTFNEVLTVDKEGQMFPGTAFESKFEIETADFNAVSGRRYGVDTSSNIITATLPATPATGDAIYFADGGGNYATNNLTIGRNGNTIMGLAQDMTVSTNNQSFGIFYNGTTWRVY